MKIAITYDNGKIFNHFGNCPNFKFYNIIDNKVANFELVEINPKGQAEVAKFLGSQNVTHLICGGLGSEARQTLDELGIKYFPKVKVSPDEAVEHLLSETLEYSLERGCCGSGKENHKCGGCKKNK